MNKAGSRPLKSFWRANWSVLFSKCRMPYINSCADTDEVDQASLTLILLTSSYPFSAHARRLRRRSGCGQQEPLHCYLYSLWSNIYPILVSLGVSQYYSSSARPLSKIARPTMAAPAIRALSMLMLNKWSDMSTERVMGVQCCMIQSFI